MGLDPRALAEALGTKPAALLAKGARAAGARAQANGARAEDDIIAANRLYRVREVAQIDKIPTAIVRHRSNPKAMRPGHFIASYAGIDERDGAPVDFIGHAIIAGQLRPVRIEVKSSSSAHLDLDRRPGQPTLPPHQVKDLEIGMRMGAVAGVMARITTKARGAQPKERWFWIPMVRWIEAVRRAEAAGQASLHQGDIEGVGIECSTMPNGAPDWLAAVTTGVQEGAPR